MRAFGVILGAPGFDDLARLRHRDEPVLVQTLIAESSVKAFDVGVFDRLAGPDERQSDLTGIGLRVEHSALELRTMVDGDRLRLRQGPALERPDSLTLAPAHFAFQL